MTSRWNTTRAPRRGSPSRDFGIGRRRRASALFLSVGWVGRTVAGGQRRADHCAGDDAERRRAGIGAAVTLAQNGGQQAAGRSAKNAAENRLAAVTGLGESRRRSRRERVEERRWRGNRH